MRLYYDTSLVLIQSTQILKEAAILEYILAVILILTKLPLHLNPSPYLFYAFIAYTLAGEDPEGSTGAGVPSLFP